MISSSRCHVLVCSIFVIVLARLSHILVCFIAILSVIVELIESLVLSELASDCFLAFSMRFWRKSLWSCSGLTMKFSQLIHACAWIFSSSWVDCAMSMAMQIFHSFTKLEPNITNYINYAYINFAEPRSANRSVWILIISLASNFSRQYLLFLYNLCLRLLLIFQIHLPLSVGIQLFQIVNCHNLNDWIVFEGFLSVQSLNLALVVLYQVSCTTTNQALSHKSKPLQNTSTDHIWYSCQTPVFD